MAPPGTSKHISKSRIQAKRSRQKNRSKSLAQAFVLVMTLQLTSSVLAQDDEYINPDRPGIADGSKVVGAGRAQIEAGIQKEFRRSGPVSDQRLFVPALFRVGIDRRWEVRVESNTFTLQNTSGPENGESQGH